mgnify:CR=1 FL=1
MQAVIVTFGTPSQFSRFGKALSPDAAYKLYTQGTAFKFTNGRNVKFGSPETRSQRRLKKDQMQALRDKNARESAKAIIIQRVARGKIARKANRMSPCLICMENMFSNDKVQPWGCGRHDVCNICAQSIAQSQYPGCPQCRAPPKNGPVAVVPDDDSESDDRRTRWEDTRRWSGDNAYYTVGHLDREIYNSILPISSVGICTWLLLSLIHI